MRWPFITSSVYVPLPLRQGREDLGDQHMAAASPAGAGLRVWETSHGLCVLTSLQTRVCPFPNREGHRRFGIEILWSERFSKQTDLLVLLFYVALYGDHAQ